MINPHMATTLNFITTDVSISADMLQCVLSDVVQDTYNCLCVDGDMSTNDMVLVMADGMTGNKEICDSSEEDYKVFRGALYNVMMNLTRMLAADGEGATKLIECDVKGAPDHVQAVTAAKSVKTRHQLLQFKRLYQIVIRTAVQTLYLIRQCILCRQQQYFSLIIFFTQALAQVKAT